MSKIKDVIIESFRIGYQSGHEDTVEGNFADPLDKAEDYFGDVKEKRHPDPNGVLPLTESELRDYKEKFDSESFDSKEPIDRIALHNRKIEVYHSALDEWCEFVTNYKAILWLAERFELEG